MFLSWKSNGEAPIQPSFDGAIEFWAGKDPLESYEWKDASICACGQYSKSIGDKSWMARNDRRTIVLWENLNAVASYEPRTFGALTERARRMKSFA